MDQQTPQSFIQIIFKEPGSVLFDAQVNGVTPLQFLALGEYFRLLGETQLAKEQMQREEEARRKKIAIPGNMDWNVDLKD